jgi:mandelate racemase
MGLAEAASLPVSSHISVEASAHLLAITPTVHWLEYLDLAGAVLAESNRPTDGAATAKGRASVVEWDEAAINRFAVDRG